MEELYTCAMYSALAEVQHFSMWNRISVNCGLPVAKVIKQAVTMNSTVEWDGYHRYLKLRPSLSWESVITYV